MVNMIVNWFLGLIEGVGIKPPASYVIFQILLVVFIIALCFFAQWLIQKLLLYLKDSYQKRFRIHIKYDSIILKSNIFKRIGYMATPMIVNAFSGFFPNHQVLISKFVSIYAMIVIIMIMRCFLDIVNDVYNLHEVSKARPIKGMLQALEIVIIGIGGIIIIGILIDKNPVILLSGLGALAAVLSLVFKDSLLGLVAGFQLAFNDMVRIGDWIEVPSYNMSGTVTEISLQIVKIDNFDNTFTTIPAYTLFSTPFKNWRGMTLAGNRRFIRSMRFDTNSITLATEEMLARLKNSGYLTDDMRSKMDSVKKNANEGDETLLTNIGLFRLYILHYLRKHSMISKEQSILVRQLPNDGAGTVLETTAFINDTNGINYENIQTDMFEYLTAITPIFGLRIFQQPTAADAKRGIEGGRPPQKKQRALNPPVHNRQESEKPVQNQNGKTPGKQTGDLPDNQNTQQKED